MRGKKRKNLFRDGGASEPLSKRLNVSTSPSPLVFSTSSRPVSVMSAASSFDVIMNGGDTTITTTTIDVDVVDTPLQIAVGGQSGKRKHGGKTSAPLGGRGKFQKKKGAGGGSMSAAASAGAMAGALAASNAAFATLGYSLPTTTTHHYQAPSPSNHCNLSALPLPPSSHGTTTGSSTHSSPRASPSPVAFTSTAVPQQTPPGSRHSAGSRTLHTHTKNSS